MKDYSETTGGRTENGPRKDLLLNLGVESEKGVVQGISRQVCDCNIGYFLTSLS